LETLLPAFWTGCEQHGIAAPMVVRQLSRNPARHFLFDDRKGSLDAGADADIVLLKPERYAYDSAASLSAVRWSSFEGMEFSVRVEATYCRGTLVYQRGAKGAEIRNQSGYGRFLRPRAANGMTACAKPVQLTIRG
jgi:allantoinase